MYHFKFIKIMKIVKLLLVVMLLSVNGIANSQTKSQIKTLLESFCVEHYDDCFRPRLYVDGSLTVNSVSIDENTYVVKAEGTHSYRGQHIPFYGRKTHSGVAWKAEIKVLDTGVKIKFYKWYEPDFFDGGHWEVCEKVVPIE